MRKTEGLIQESRSLVMMFGKGRETYPPSTPSRPRHIHAADADTGARAESAARKIIECAQTGERDPIRLRDCALKALR